MVISAFGFADVLLKGPANLLQLLIDFIFHIASVGFWLGLGIEFGSTDR